MDNNVVRALGEGLARRGLLTLRFDYRGVGQSQGPEVDVARHMAAFWKTSHAPGEMDFAEDVLGAAGFVRQESPGLRLALIGYSFGCALLPSVEPRDDVAALVLVAPTVAKHSYDAFRSVNRPLLVVASEDDFATEADRLEEWFGTLPLPRQFVRKRCDNHFFRGHEDWLIETVFRFLEKSWR
jgi:alpha/beta superfamily hydrolase